MAAMSRLMPMMALSTFAIFLLALLATPTNALSNTEPHVHARGHDSVAKRKRNALKRAKRCRPKTSSLGAATSTSVAPSDTPAPTTHKAVSHPPTTQAPSATPTTSKAVATTSAPPPPPSTGGGGGTQKLVWAWPNGNQDLKYWGGKNVKGVYSWSPFSPNPSQINVPFYPMLWGSKQKSDFQSKVDGSKYEYCMFLNEPNQHDQSNMSVDDAVQLYWSVMDPARKQGCKVVSPATTSAPTGLQWLKEFNQKCPGCFDIVALHWYDVNADDFKKYITNFYNAFKKPVWITEFACQNFNGGSQCSADQTWALHTTMAKFAKDTPWIEGIAPFGAMREMQGVNPDNQLMDPSTGKPNALGQFWANGDW
ncbi:glycoside hydrolase family 128 protein [Ceratobasidium sp. AG-Ba]|nr:glycoside hydrolase family 128 protein [Ceratobasidium sp. AG-Ba]